MDNSLFSEEMLNATIADNAIENKGPVKVLGMEFANDDERRAYFREELRKKLPELKQIEGFPIGEDDDIINLSDPPYYTACPNPWINDFINEWENNKNQLEADGNRNADFDVKEPYASDVSEGKNNPVYNAHTYHTKVPHPAIMRYILHYTQPGDIVFDGFCGTGMTGVAAKLCGSETEVSALGLNSCNIGNRHSICSDLSPIASLVAASLNVSLHSSFKKKAEGILAQVYEELGWMYQTKNQYGALCDVQYYVWSDVFVCPICGKEFVFYDVATDKNTGLVNDSFVCPHCNSTHTKRSVDLAFSTEYDAILGESVQVAKRVPVLVKYKIDRKTYIKEFDSYDQSVLDRINSISVTKWIPLYELKKGEKTPEPKRVGINRIYQFYTKRNLIILSEIYNRIQNDIHLKMWFTSQLVNISHLNRYRPGVSFPYNPLNGTFYVASQICESNVFEAYKNKVAKVDAALSLCRCGDNVVNICSATNLCINDNCIDYIFVDPPFGANIMYSELNSVTEGWLKVLTNDTEEAIISRVQSKSVFTYQSLINSSLKEFYRILKPGKWLTMEFSNTSASVWNSIQNALQGVGFVITNVAAIDKQQGSFNAVTSTTAVKQDLIITCFKPSDSFISKFENSDDLHNVWDFVEEYLVHTPIHIERNHSTTAIVERSSKIIYDRLITYFVQRNLPVPLDASDFLSGLKERFVERDGMYFTAIQVAEYDEKKKLAPEFIPMGLIVSNEADGIEWLRNRLRVHGPQTYQQIQPEWMQAINGLRKNDILPELKDLLYENFIEEADGKWRLPNVQDDVDKAALRTKALLKEFKIYVEVAQKPKAKLKEVRVEAVRAGFKQCYIDKDFQTIVMVGDKIPQNLLTEDEILLQFYDIAVNHV